jgi:hypothetical protein
MNKSTTGFLGVAFVAVGPVFLSRGDLACALGKAVTLA